MATYTQAKSLSVNLWIVPYLPWINQRFWLGKRCQFDPRFCYDWGMKCPVCNKAMELSSSDVSHNPKNGTKYDRKIYVCKNDGTWANIEIPKTKN